MIDIATNPGRNVVTLCALVLASALASPSAYADGFADGEAEPQRELTARDRALLHRSTTVKTAAPKPMDPLEVNRFTSVKDTPRKEIVLPGVLRIDGESAAALDPTRARRISMNNGGSQTVYVSVTDPNRIQLPFANPYLVSTDEVEIKKRPNSNNIYISFVNQKGPVTHPVQLFAEPPEGGVVLGLQLVPKRIPSQTIIVTDDAASSGAKNRLTNGSGGFIERVQTLLETVALGGVPHGFSSSNLQAPPVVLNGLLVEASKRLSNRSGDIYVYVVTNHGQAEALLQESEFDGESVQAVSIFPKPLLKPGEKTFVAVLTKKAEN